MIECECVSVIVCECVSRGAAQPGVRLDGQVRGLRVCESECVSVSVCACVSVCVCEWECECVCERVSV